MANYFKKALRCGCCGASFEANVLAGLYQGTTTGLDTNPHQPAIYDLYIACPGCGYSGVNISKADQKTVDYVLSDDYKSLIRATQEDDILRRIKGAAAIAAHQKDFKAAGYANLVLSWYLRDKELPPAEALTQCIDCYCRYLSVTRDYDVAIILIDCMRQIAHFDEADETARSLLEYVKDARLLAIIKYERALIAKKDTSPHLISEVPV